MKKLIWTTTALLLLPLTVNANTALGVRDCGQWTTSKGAIRIMMEVWVLGFLSGLNNGVRGGDQLAKVNSRDQIFVWVDNYCRTNPLSDLRIASYELFAELQNRK